MWIKGTFYRSLHPLLKFTSIGKLERIATSWFCIVGLKPDICIGIRWYPEISFHPIHYFCIDVICGPRCQKHEVAKIVRRNERRLFERTFLFLQSEQKRFLQQHKLRSESYSKAAAAMKRQRKKNTKSTKTSGMAMDKELKVRRSLFIKII